MRSNPLLRRVWLATALGLAGCGKATPEAKATAAPAAAQPAAVSVAERLRPEALTPSTISTRTGEPPRSGTSFLPGPATVPPPVPVVQAVPAPVPQPPAPVPQPPAPVPQPPAPVPQPPPTTPPQPEPTPLPNATPESKAPAKPIEYPKQIDGKTLEMWINEIRYNPTNLQPATLDPQSREIAIKVLPSFGPSARKPALKPLIAVVDYDPDPGVRQAAVTVISNMGYEEDAKEKGTLMAKDAVKSIQSRLAKTAPGSAERLTCVRSLASFGSDAAGSAKSLRDICRDPSYETRIAIANALGRVGMAPDDTAEANKEAAMALLEFMIVDVCASVRMETIQSLLILGPPKSKTPSEYAKAIEPYLKGVGNRLKAGTGEKDRNVICWLLLLQVMYDGGTLDANVKQLANFIKAPEGPNVANLRMNAMNALAVLGTKAVGALDVLLDALEYEDPYLVAAAISCLAPMGTAAARAIPKLEAIAKREPVKPKDAPADWKPDLSLQNLAKEAIPYVKGEKKIGQP
jgi:HEAT repeat protein